MGADLVDGEGRRGSTGMLTAPLNLGRTHVWIAHLSCPLPSSSAFFACSPPLACSLSLTPDLPPLPHPLVRLSTLTSSSSLIRPSGLLPPLCRLCSWRRRTRPTWSTR